MEIDKVNEARFARIANLREPSANVNARSKIPTQMLIGSSLADDFAGPSFAMTPPVQETADTQAGAVDEENTEAPRSSVVLIDDSTLELDDLNQHETMVNNAVFVVVMLF